MIYPTIKDTSYIIWIIVGCSLLFTILVFVVLGRCIYLLFRGGKWCFERASRSYTSMPEITKKEEGEKIFSFEVSL